MTRTFKGHIARPGKPVADLRTTSADLAGGVRPPASRDAGRSASSGSGPTASIGITHLGDRDYTALFRALVRASFFSFTCFSPAAARAETSVPNRSEGSTPNLSWRSGASLPVGGSVTRLSFRIAVT